MRLTILVLLGKRLLLFSTGSFTHVDDATKLSQRESKRIFFFPPSTQQQKHQKPNDDEEEEYFLTKEIRLISVIQFNLLLLLSSYSWRKIFFNKEDDYPTYLLLPSYSIYILIYWILEINLPPQITVSLILFQLVGVLEDLKKTSTKIFPWRWFSIYHYR